jgi:hypothetical protein
MPFNGSGQYNLPAGSIVADGTTIDAADLNTPLQDIEASLSQTVLRNGAAPLTGNLSAGGHKITNIAAATAADDVPTFRQAQSGASSQATSVGGTANAITLTFSPPFTAYETGMRIRWFSGGANTGAATVNVDALGVKDLRRDNALTLSGGDLPASGALVEAVYDGTRFLVTRKASESLSLKDFGAVGDGTADDTSAVNAWFAAMLASGRAGFVPAGTYRVTAPIVFDYVSTRLFGFTIYGEGVQKSLFVSTITTAGAAAFSIVTSGGSVGAPTIGVYPKISQVGFRANFPGSTMRVGYTNYSDQQNLVRLETWISNSSDSSQANCLEMNACYGCNIEYNGGLGTTENAGDNLRLRQCSFGHFFVSLGGTVSGMTPNGTAAGIRITGDFSFGNVFVAPDIEYFDKGLVIDTQNAVRNTFIGGTWGDFKTCVVQATAGAENRFINPNLNAPGKPFVAAGGAVGILRDTALLQTAAPTGGSTVTTLNSTRYLKLTPAGSISTLTVVLPANPSDQQIVTIQTTAEITTLTLSSAPATIFDAVTTLGAGASVSYIFNAVVTNWLRV